MEETKKQTKPENSSDQYILRAMDYITESLLEINAYEFEHDVDETLHARKEAFVEALSKLMEWPDAKKYGYDWDVEVEFPV